MGRRSAPGCDARRSAGELSRAGHPSLPGRHDPSQLGSRPPRGGGLASGCRRLAAAFPRLPPDRLAAVHRRFEAIHPFLDGNGRTGRLLLNLVLVRLGYPPAIIYKRQRAEYLRALRRADGGDCGLLGELLARAVLDNLYKFVVAMVAGPVRLVPLAALATPVITADALRTAAGRGRLEATRGADGEWRSSRKWVDEYLDGRYRRDQ
ncbi:MAG TPA: Fic family protein [Acidimicrobiales bacterium]|nr:Fic family protein [Acidimicrobiales bacterium]